MNNKPWSKEELESLKSDLSNRDLSAKLDRSEDAIRIKRRGQRPATSYEKDTKQARESYWQSEFQRLFAKYNKALNEKSAVDILIESASQLAPQSYSPAPPITSNRKASAKDTPQSAVLMFSDTHVGKVTMKEQTLGFGEYNFDLFLARLKFLEESVISILKNHTNTPIPELVIAMLGDMLDGSLAHSTEAGQRNTKFQQFYGAGHAIAQFFRNLSQHVPKIRLYTAVGNHPRWDNQKKMPSDNRYSNLDMFLYAYVQALTADIPTIEWKLDMQPFSIFDVQNFVFHGSHGDHWRGGDKALGIPNHAIGRSVSVTTQLFVKHGRKVPNYYLAGHLHRGIKIPHAMGDVLINGGFPGLDNYALGESFNPVDPVQRFFMVHPKYGKTASYEIGLKWAESRKLRPYTIPEGIIITE